MILCFIDKNNNLNTTDQKGADKSLRTVNKITFFIFCSFAVLSLLFNFTVLLLFISIPSYHRMKIPNIMFFIQSITDILVTIPLTLDAIYNNPFAHNSPNFSRSFLTALAFFFNYSMFLTVAMLLLVTVERFLAIKFPFHHRTYITINKIVLAVIFTFIVCTIHPIVHVICIYPSSDKSLMKQYDVTMGSISFVIIISVYALLVVCYITIKTSINRRINRRIKKQEGQV